MSNKNTVIIGVLVVIILFLMNYKHSEKDHYKLYIESDTIKIYNEDKVIYKEYINYSKPNKLQQSIINDNL